MHFVDDINPHFQSGGGVIHFLPNFPDIVHAVVGGGVDFRDVHSGFRQGGPAAFALVAGVAIFGGQAVGRPSQNLGAGGLAGASRAGEQIGVRKPTRSRLGFQSRRNMLLTDHVVKGQGPPFAVKGLMRQEYRLPTPTEK
jgi:hypothetical protein